MLALHSHNLRTADHAMQCGLVDYRPESWRLFLIDGKVVGLF